MIRAVIYCRCSTEEECQRDALVRQAAEARECVRRLNWFLADEYIESRSGTSVRGREQYQRLFEDLLGKRFDVVVIKSQDRLMRNTKDWYIFIDRLVSCRKKLYLYLEQRFYTADDSLITGIKAILAEEYSRELSRKINNAHKHRQQTGNALMLTSNTYGYRKLPDKSFEIIEEEAQVKRQMYELCAAGYGSRTIARLLREKGIRKRNGTCFSDSDIRRMIRNPINKGTVVMNRRHFDFDTKQMVKNPNEDQYVYENRIPAIVSKELWERANREIDKRAGKETAGNTGTADPVSEAITQGLGGKKNISDVDCCATRLRITVHDAARVNDEIIKTTGSRGIVKKGQGVQIIYGPQVTVIKAKLEDYLETAPDEYYESAAVSEENSAEENTDTVNENNETQEKVVNTIVVSSPITGMAGDITTCPDEGFAGKMMGDGAVVTPEDAVICAPEDGEVLFVFETKHALGFQTESGLGMLLHIGIDTVSLNGEGFEVFVENGQKVKKGDPLMKIDIPFLASHAPSLCSPVLCTELEENQRVRLLATGEVKAGDPLFAVDTVE